MLENSKDKLLNDELFDEVNGGFTAISKPTKKDLVQRGDAGSAQTMEYDTSKEYKAGALANASLKEVPGSKVVSGGFFFDSGKC